MKLRQNWPNLLQMALGLNPIIYWSRSWCLSLPAEHLQATGFMPIPMPCGDCPAEYGELQQSLLQLQLVKHACFFYCETSDTPEQMALCSALLSLAQPCSGTLPSLMQPCRYHGLGREPHWADMPPFVVLSGCAPYLDSMSILHCWLCCVYIWWSIATTWGASASC